MVSKTVAVSAIVIGGLLVIFPEPATTVTGLLIISGGVVALGVKGG